MRKKVQIHLLNRLVAHVKINRMCCSRVVALPTGRVTSASSRLRVASAIDALHPLTHLTINAAVKSVPIVLLHCAVQRRSSPPAPSTLHQHLGQGNGSQPPWDQMWQCLPWFELLRATSNRRCCPSFAICFATDACAVPLSASATRFVATCRLILPQLARRRCLGSLGLVSRASSQQMCGSKPCPRRCPALVLKGFHQHLFLFHRVAS